jgi:hypothetical protein
MALFYVIFFISSLSLNFLCSHDAISSSKLLKQWSHDKDAPKLKTEGHGDSQNNYDISQYKFHVIPDYLAAGLLCNCKLQLIQFRGALAKTHN